MTIFIPAGHKMEDWFPFTKKSFFNTAIVQSSLKMQA